MPRFGTVVLVVVLATIAAGAASAAPPSPPAAYYGSLTANGEPAPAGVTVTAEIAGEVRGQLTTANVGSYGGAGAFEPKLQVDGSADDTDDSVTFYVDGAVATPTVEWRSGDVRRVDLSVAADLSPPEDGGDTGGGGTGGSGPSGGQSSAGGNAGTVTPAPAVPEITVDGTEDGAEVTVSNVRAGETVSVDLADSGSASSDGPDDVVLDALDVTTTRDTALSLSISHHVEPPPEAPPLVDAVEPPVGYIEVDHSVPDGEIDEVAFHFGVSRDRLAERDVPPEDVTLYRLHDGDWTALETTLVGSTDAHYRLQAVSPGLSVFAIGTRGTADGSALPDQTPTPTRTPAAESTPSVTSSSTPDVTDEPEREAAQTEAPGQPGFGVVAALVAVLGASLLASRRLG